MAERSKARVCGRSLAGVVGLNPARGMDVLCCMCCTVRTKRDNQDKEVVQMKDKNISGGGEIFHTRPDRPWGPPSLLCNGYRVYLPGTKRPGRGVSDPHPTSAEVKERVELYLHSPSGSSCPVLRRTLPFLCIHQ